jgi:hypothetical protein
MPSAAQAMPIAPSCDAGGRAGRQQSGHRGALVVGARRFGLREVEQSRDDQRELHAEKGGQKQIKCSTRFATPRGIAPTGRRAKT